MDFDVVFIAGPQGSGKGTQGKRMAEKLGFFFWGMGGILREMIREGSPLGQKIAAAVNEGDLLSDDLIIEVLKQKLPQLPANKGVVFDGVPRRPGQAAFLIDFLASENRKRLATVFVDLPREESVKRLLLRAKSESRVDDTPEGIERRFRFYDEAMKPTLDYLKKTTEFIELDGNLPIDVVTENINAALGI